MRIQFDCVCFFMPPPVKIVENLKKKKRAIKNRQLPYLPRGVLQAMQSLTSVFGKGTGGTSALTLPDCRP